MKTIPLGDLHHGRQTALVVRGDVRFISKPRDCQNEDAFAKFCNAVAELGFCAFSRPPRILSCGQYEHTQTVEDNLPTDVGGVERYYFRAGALLFFSYVFAATDLHCENLIAVGDMPVVVDLETILSGRVARGGRLYNLSRSVMCSHLLCNFAEGAVDVSGLSGTAAGLKNVPHVGGEHVFPWEQSDALMEGFRQAYCFAMARREEIGELLDVFDRCRLRQILRPTGVYDKIARTLAAAPEEERREKAYEMLGRAYRKDIDQDRLAKAGKILDEEVRAALAGEIPLFYVHGGECDLRCGEEIVFRGHLSASPVEYARQRLNELSEEDMQRQLGVIRLAIAASTPLERAGTAQISLGAQAPGEGCARMVIESAVNGLPSVFCGLSGGNRIALTSIGYGLYSGLTGVMCMLGAMYRSTGKNRYRELLTEYFAKLEPVLGGGEKILLNDANVSLGDGVAGIILGLCHVAELTETRSFAREAARLAERLVVTKQLTNADYLNGAGALPAALHRCGIRSAEPYEALAPLLESEKPYTTGVAHGAAGLGLGRALIRAHAPSCMAEQALLDAVRWENESFSPEDGNWLDLRSPGRRGFMSGWCSGAPGIGMARAALLELAEGVELKELCRMDVNRAKRFLETETSCKRDTLCCGAGARLMAASRLGVRCDDLYARLCEAEQRGSVRVFHCANTADVNVSLMQGLSGVAYALLMYGDPLGGGMLL